MEARASADTETDTEARAHARAHADADVGTAREAREAWLVVGKDGDDPQLFESLEDARCYIMVSGSSCIRHVRVHAPGTRLPYRADSTPSCTCACECECKSKSKSKRRRVHAADVDATRLVAAYFASADVCGVPQAPLPLQAPAQEPAQEPTQDDAVAAMNAMNAMNAMAARAATDAAYEDGRVYGDETETLV